MTNDDNVDDDDDAVVVVVVEHWVVFCFAKHLFRDVLDQIDKNVQSAVVATGDSYQQLVAAEQSAISARKVRIASYWVRMCGEDCSGGGGCVV